MQSVCYPSYLVTLTLFERQTSDQIYTWKKFAIGNVLNTLAPFAV